MIKDFKHKDQEFIKNLELVCQELLKKEVSQKADIEISKLLSYV